MNTVCPAACASGTGPLGLGLSIATCIRWSGLPLEMRKVKQTFGSDMGHIYISVLRHQPRRSHSLSNSDEKCQLCCYCWFQQKHQVFNRLRADSVAAPGQGCWMTPQFLPKVKEAMNADDQIPVFVTSTSQKSHTKLDSEKPQNYLVFLIDKTSVVFPEHLNMQYIICYRKTCK